MTDRASAEGLRGWTVNEGKDDDGSYFIESKVMPGCVVGADTRDEAWSQWPEVVELWASTANENRVKAERDLLALRDTGPRPDSGIEAPIGDQPDSITVNGHMFVHVAACPCDRIQAEVARLSTPRTETSDMTDDNRDITDPRDEDIMEAWGVIVSEAGGWTTQTQEWQDAAARWRDRVIPALSTPRTETSDD